MASRRMISIKIIDTDVFLALPITAQNLYFHLALRADDDGFIASPLAISRMIGATEGDMQALTKAEYLIRFKSGICVITHWLVHNLIRKDRYTATMHIAEMAQLDTKTASKTGYSLLASTLMEDGNQAATKWQPSGNRTATEDRTGKDRAGKDRTVYQVSAEEIRKEFIAEVIQAWNDLGLQTVRAIKKGSERYKHLSARVKEYSETEILVAIKSISGSQYLLGGGKNGWRISIDWLLLPNNFQKVAEGNYIDRNTLTEPAEREQKTIDLEQRILEKQQRRKTI